MEISHVELDRQKILKPRDVWTRWDDYAARENEDDLSGPNTGDDWEFAEGVLDKTCMERQHPNSLYQRSLYDDRSQPGWARMQPDLARLIDDSARARYFAYTREHAAGA